MLTRRCPDSGIGGGGFGIVRGSNGSYEVVDFRETAPAGSNETMYANASSTIGGLASGVPGELRGLEYLHTNYGKLPWKTLVEPAVKVARDGFPVTADLVTRMNMTTPSNAFLYTDPTWAIDFAPNGTLVGVGDVMTRKRYGDTLEAIACYGPDAFYAGPIANATIQALRRTGGIMTLADLQNYTVAIRPPLSISYRGYQLHSIPVPASGVVVLSALKALEGYPPVTPATLDLTVHRFDEVLRFGYGARADMGDPAFVAGTLTYEDQLLSAAHAADVRARIDDARTQNTSAYDPSLFATIDTPGTSEITAVDASGMAVSVTTTINLLFGSQVLVPETGVILNDEMDDFSKPGVSNSFGYAPSPNNYVRPGKRPQSSISCTIVDRPDGSLYVSLGAAGGSRIITANAQNLWHILDQGMSAAEALAQPRFHDQLIPNTMSFEYPYDNATTAFLKGRGHNVSWVAPGESAAQAIRRLENGTLEAAGEPRLVNSGGYAF